jgi:hypothetical protein
MYGIFSEGMHDIATYIKDVLRTLRELKKSSGLAFEMLKLLSDGQESSIVMLTLASIMPKFKQINEDLYLLKNAFLVRAAGYVEPQGA